MAVIKTNKDGTRQKRGNRLNSDEIYYIRRHLEHGISKERIAERCCCDLSDIETVHKILLKEQAKKGATHGNSRVSSRV